MKNSIEVIDIHSKAPYPSCSISNFAKHKFIFYDIECASMEGLLQSFTEKNPRLQIEICQLIGIEAKLRGRANREKWQKNQILWWQGMEIKRHSYQYQELLKEAYDALSKNMHFCKALLKTGNAKLIHSIGTKNPSATILTEREFCSQLIRVRSKLEEIYRGK